MNTGILEYYKHEFVLIEKKLHLILKKEKIREREREN